MDENVLSKTYALKAELENDERIIRLNAIEKEMNESNEVMALAYKKDAAADNYAEMVRLFKDDSEEARKARILLSEAKSNLDNHPLVKEYTKLYQEIRELYLNINEVLFSSLNPSLCPKENKQWE